MIIKTDDVICPECGGKLKYYDTVQRLVRTKHRQSGYIELRRMKCSNCGGIHREITEDIFPYKHYEAEIIIGVVEGLITEESYGFEDYPCEMTMTRWRSQYAKFAKAIMKVFIF